MSPVLSLHFSQRLLDPVTLYHFTNSCFEATHLTGEAHIGRVGYANGPAVGLNASLYEVVLQQVCIRLTQEVEKMLFAAGPRCQDVFERCSFTHIYLHNSRILSYLSKRTLPHHCVRSWAEQFKSYEICIQYEWKPGTRLGGAFQLSLLHLYVNYFLLTLYAHMHKSYDIFILRCWNENFSLHCNDSMFALSFTSPINLTRTQCNFTMYSQPNIYIPLPKPRNH